MRKVSYLLTSLLIIGLMGGCGVPVESSSNSESGIILGDPGDDWGEKTQIYDKNNNIIGELKNSNILFLLEDSVIYTEYPSASISESSTEYSVNTEYYRYMFDSKEVVLLGKVDFCSHENYDSVRINNHVYLSIATNLGDSGSALRFYDINLEVNSMTELFSEASGYPYSSMTLVNNQIFYTMVLENGCDLKEYNPETNETRIRMTFNFNNRTNTGETVRGITSDKNTISLLILKMQTERDVQLRVDIYDHDMNFQRSVDLSSIRPSGEELRQGVVRFACSNGYIYYENFSTTRFLGKIEGDTLTPLMETGGAFTMATEVGNNEVTNLFFEPFHEENELYLLNKTDGTFKKAAYLVEIEDKKYTIRDVLKIGDDKILLSMSYKDSNNGKKFNRLYYLNLSDLDFQDMP